MVENLPIKALSSLICVLVISNLLITTTARGVNGDNLAVLGYDLDVGNDRDPELLDRIGVPHLVVDPGVLAEMLSVFSVLIVQYNSYDYSGETLMKNSENFARFVHAGGILFVFPQEGSGSYDWLPVQVIRESWMSGMNLQIETYHEILNGLDISDFRQIYARSLYAFEAIYWDCLIVLVEPSHGNAVLVLIPYGEGIIVLSALRLDDYMETWENFDKALKIYRKFVEWSLSEPKLGKTVVPTNTRLKTKVYPYLLEKTCLQPCPQLISKHLDIKKIRNFVELQFRQWFSYSDSHMQSVSQGILVLKLLNETTSLEEELIVRIQDFQKVNGGFNFQNSFDPNLTSELDDTYFATRSLLALGAFPKNMSGCIEFVNNQLQEDGSYGGESFLGAYDSHLGFYRHAIYRAFYAVSTLKMFNASILRSNDTATFIKSFQIGWGDFSGTFSPYPTEELRRDDSLRKEEYSLSIAISFYALLTLELLGQDSEDTDGLTNYARNQTADLLLLNLPYPLLCLKALGQNPKIPEELCFSLLNNAIRDIEFNVELQDLFEAILLVSAIANYFPETFKKSLKPPELLLPDPEIKETSVAILDNTNVNWDTEIYNQIGLSCDAISPFDLYSAKLEKYRVIIVPHTEDPPDEFTEALRASKGAISRFVKSGGVLIVFPQRNGYYNWLPVTVKSERTYYRGGGNKAFRLVRHQILANLTFLDFQNWDYTWSITFEKISLDFVVILENYWEEPVLALCKYGKGTIVFTALLADSKAGFNSNARRVLRNLVIWSLSSSSVPSAILSEQSFANYLHMVCVLLVLVFFSLAFSLDVFLRNPKNLPLTEQVKDFFRSKAIFTSGIAVFIADYFLHNPLTRVVLISLLLYKTNFLNLFHVKTLKEEKNNQEKKKRLLSTLVTVSYCIIFSYSMNIIFSRSMDIFPEFSEALNLLVIGILFGPLFTLLARSISRYFVEKYLDIPDKSSCRISLEENKKRYSLKRAVPYYVGCYLFGAGLITSILIVPIADTPSVAPSNLASFLITAIFIIWGLRAIMQKQKRPPSKTSILLQVTDIFLTPKGVIYGLLWLVLFVGGMNVFSSTLFELIEQASINPRHFVEVVTHITYVFYMVIFPSYLIYHVTKEHIRECGIKNQKSSKIVNPIPFFIMLFLYFPVVSVSLQLSMLYGYVGLILVFLWIYLAIHSDDQSYSMFMVELSPNNEDLFLALLILSYAGGIILSWYLFEIETLGLVVFGGLLAYFGLSFYAAQKLYLSNRLRFLRIFLYLLSLLVGLFLSGFAWWLYVLSWIQATTISDIWGFLNDN